MRVYNRRIWLYTSTFLLISLLIGLLIYLLPKMEFLYSWIRVNLVQYPDLSKFFELMVLRKGILGYSTLVFFSICNGGVITILSIGTFYCVRCSVIEWKIKKSEKKALKEKRVLLMKGDMK